jgi:hypothetical protein
MFTKFNNLDTAPQLYVVYYIEENSGEVNFRHVIAHNPEEAKTKVLEDQIDNNDDSEPISEIEGAYAVTGTYKLPDGTEYFVEARMVYAPANTTV